MSISYSGNSILNESYTLTCTAHLSGYIASRFSQYLVLEWIGPNGIALSEENGVTLGWQQTSDAEATRSLTFHTLNEIHGGRYECVAELLLPNSTVSFNSTREHYLNIISKYM